MTTPLRILIVDDDRFARAVLRDAVELEAADAEIAEAGDGDEALEKVRAAPPDLVLLDLFMPKRSGIQALGDIRQAAPETQVVVISSLDSPALVEQAKQAGAMGFILKPFHALEIQAAVRQALGGR